MYKHSFDFGSSNLSIVSKKVLKKQLLDQIFRFIQFVRYDVSHIIHNSSGYTLNTTEENTVCNLSKEFIYYLKFNFQKAKETDFAFYPFKPNKTKKLEFEDIFTVEKNLVIKKVKIFFDSTILLQAFIMDQIFDLLKENEISDFIIDNQNYYRSDGFSEWPVTFKVENLPEFKRVLKEGSLSLNFNFNKNLKPKYTFGSMSKLLKYKYAIYQTDTCVDSVLLNWELQKLSTEFDYKSFAHLNKIDLTVIDEHDNIVEFAPIK
jgi:hypothetical protein